MTKRVLIVGHGAIGSVFAAAFATAGFEIDALSSVSTRTEKKSRRLFAGDTQILDYDYTITSVPNVLEPYDIVVLAVKTTDLARVAPAIKRYVSIRTTLISSMNGIPWWFKHGVTSHPDLHAIPHENIVGCVINMAATKLDDGIIEMRGSRELLFGDVDSASERATFLLPIFQQPWLHCRYVPDIRVELWRKLLNNTSVNPVSALCMANCGQVTADAGTRAIICTIMREVIDVGNACGVQVDVDIEERINWSASYGAFKTSMVQDIEAKKALEVDDLLSSVVALGKRSGVATPYLSCITSLVALRSAINASDGKVS